MKRWCLLLLPLVALTGFVRAQEPADPQERLRQFRRDLPLIEKLVENGLKLAAEENVFQRAEVCHNLAKDFAQEINKSAADADARRVAFLGDGLRLLLVRGVAQSLESARKELPMDQARQKQVQAAGKEVLNLIQPLEAQLDLTAARGEIRKAVEGPTATHQPPPPVGKKLGGKKSN